MMLIWWFFQKRRRRGGRDGDAALLLLLHPVHRGGAVVDLADLVVDPGVEEDALGRRGLAGVDVRHDADVADLGQVRQDVECHSLSHLAQVRRLAVVREVRDAAVCAGARARPAYRPVRHQR